MKRIWNLAESEKYRNGKGVYTHASFASKARGDVAFNVYLPPNWSRENKPEYPLILLLHGQGGDEGSFSRVPPADFLNRCIGEQQALPECVIVALRGGKDTMKTQWTSRANVKMLTSAAPGELRRYCADVFNTSMERHKTAIIGHSRGASGALYCGFTHPEVFGTVVSSAFVSDYALPMLRRAVTANRRKILQYGVRVKLLIGAKDPYVHTQNRKGSYLLCELLAQEQIAHELVVLEGMRHNMNEIWNEVDSLKYLKFCSEQEGSP